MALSKVLQNRRKELGFTQEQVAEYLGVSTPAVNKWETGKSYPDIMLLAPLARLLETDLNTLLSFEAEMTKEQEVQILNRAADLIDKEGFEAGYRMLMEEIRVYPNCYSFICQAALVMEGSFMLGTVTDKEAYMSEIEELYRRALESEDLGIRGYAAGALISKYAMRQEYDRAWELLDSFPEITFDKKQMQANLLKAQGKEEAAAELLEKHLLTDVYNVYGRLMSLMELAVRAKDMERAGYLADLGRETAQRFELSPYAALVPEFQLYAAQKDKEGCLGALEKMVDSMKEEWELSDSSLYSRIQANKGGRISMKRMLTGLLNTLEKDEELDFLKDEPRFWNLLKLSKDFQKTIDK